ncbi:NUDIX hydrolase [Methylobacterium aerolatum]|uniref:ADP-ribose pyrophosphatase YjhB (NUDIX family) n=1 Tax=Methylobacterium aerolatum TaxID=418708 RepID=A0ABU0I749_9HYPH|nr:NUDIX hydrolase [Methylobacterium aerolatum]MDQ0449474.1 ADP-ribose pyrophosphatase YjhB (NUDIX family) [Methylobacterium aerolatum]GJD33505.1 Diadenosine hexaphosphate hydrolase [Methylobacterium aerolatum]
MSEADDRTFPTRPFVGASIAVIRDGRVLLASRANEPMRGVWTLPGGLVEAGETLAEAALRELVEEVGVTAEVVGVLSPTEIIVRDGTGRARHHYVVHPHAALWRGGEPMAGPEALGVRWADLSEIGALETTPGLVGTLREAFARVDGRGTA